MNLDLQTKLEKAGEMYLDLLIRRLEDADKTRLQSESIEAIDQSMRMAAYIITTLRKIDRESREDGIICQ